VSFNICDALQANYNPILSKCKTKHGDAELPTVALLLHR
jgi:hypothetical protein